ncbi:MAG: hypothetical protein AAFW84_26980 [Cyanobacteria bacterium J06635_15]
MNTQLVNSIIQVVRALPNEEQAFLIETLNRLSQQKLDSEAESATTPAKTRPTHSTETLTTDDVWDIWQSLGDEAVQGMLENTSTQHDRYLSC